MNIFIPLTLASVIVIAMIFAVTPIEYAQTTHAATTIVGANSVTSASIALNTIDDVDVVDDGLDGTSLADALTADSLTAETAATSLTLAGNGASIILNDDSIIAGTAGTDVINIATAADGAIDDINIGGTGADTITIGGDVANVVDIVSAGLLVATNGDISDTDAAGVVINDSFQLGATGDATASIEALQVFTVASNDADTESFPVTFAAAPEVVFCQGATAGSSCTVDTITATDFIVRLATPAGVAITIDETVIVIAFDL